MHSLFISDSIRPKRVPKIGLLLQARDQVGGVFMPRSYLLSAAVALSAFLCRANPDFGMDTAGAVFNEDNEKITARAEATVLESEISRFRLADLEITAGMRILHVSLLSRKKGDPFEDSFIGSINELKANQDYAPLRPYIQVTFPIKMARVGAGAGFERMSVATMDQAGGGGDIRSDIWSVYLVTSYPNSSRFTPFGELGWSAYRNRFDPLPEWHRGGLCNFELDNSSALHVGLGCDFRIAEHFFINLYARYADVDVKGVYIFRGDERPPDPFKFTLEHIAYGAGVQCRF